MCSYVFVCILAGWELPEVARDKSSIVLSLYETTVSKTSVKGTHLMFKEQPLVDEAHKYWEEELRGDVDVVCGTIFAVEKPEIDVKKSSHAEAFDS